MRRHPVLLKNGVSLVFLCIGVFTFFENSNAEERREIVQCNDFHIVIVIPSGRKMGLLSAPRNPYCVGYLSWQV